MKRPFKNYPNRHMFFMVFIFSVACANFLSLLKQYNLTILNNDPEVFLEPGYEFADFERPLVGKKYVGFLTDKDMSPERNDGQFLKAQYRLAPTILLLHDPHHPLLIIDSVSLISAFDLMQESSSVPLIVNRYEKILAKKVP